MPHGGRAYGKGAARRNNVKKAARKRDARKTAEDQDRDSSCLFIPHITEDDLLSFQLAHFGDDIHPVEWFIDAQTALEYDPWLEDDELGYYEDGVKRTLTDEQIEMFRHSDLEMMAREERLRAEEEQEMTMQRHKLTDKDRKTDRAASPVSDASSVEGDLLGLAQQHISAPPVRSSRRDENRTRSSEPLRSTDPKTRRRPQDIPYDQRHKRKWEAYIDENDPIEGSLTHRRIVRELDEQHAKSVDLDY